MKSTKKRKLRSKRRKSGTGGVYALLFAAICVFAFVIIASSLISPGLFENLSRGADTAAALPQDSSQSGDLDVPGGDALFRITDADELYMLAAADAFAEYYRTNKEEPVIVIDGDITLDRTLDLHGGMNLIVTGSVGFADESVKIRITADGAHKISLSCDEPISRFDIEAPESDLLFDGGDIPFIREVAETQNVASYNGTSVRGAADGDTLGGRGRSTVREVTVWRNAKKTEAWAGAYSRIDGNLITVYIPHDASDTDLKALSVTVAAEGGECDLPESLDLSSPQLIDTVDANGEVRTYRIRAERARLGIPVLEIYTDDGSDIKSKEKYKQATMRLDGAEYTLQIKGRGNASWNTFPKHSYRLKLDSKAKLCGMTADRDWCLIGNYADPSLLRNKVASDMAKTMTALPFTPEYHSVDLFINGEYYGVFMLSEKIEDDKDRVPLGERVTAEDGTITDMGFLIEFGWDYSSENVYAKDYFDTRYCKRMYIKEPEITKARNAEYQYIYDYIKAAEDAIVAGAGYEDYIDVDSWVDWFIVNELTNNSECAFYRSLYMYKPVGGKLTAGPIWDYDMAFGNNLSDIPDYNGWASVDFVYKYMYSNWMKFLIKDENFMSRVRARWAEMKNTLMEAAFASIEKSADEIEASQVYNFKLWPKVLLYQIGMSRASTLGFTTWREHVDYIGEFLQMRYEWMDERLG